MIRSALRCVSIVFAFLAGQVVLAVGVLLVGIPAIILTVIANGYADKNPVIACVIVAQVAQFFWTYSIWKESRQLKSEFKRRQHND